MKIRNLSVLIISLLSIISSPAFALKVYMGGLAGVGSLDGRYDGINLVDNESSTATAGGENGFLGGQIGIEHTFHNLDCWYSAFEINIMYDSYEKTVLKSTNTSGIINNDVHLQNTFLYGAHVKLGKDYRGFIPYGVAGIQAGRWIMNLGNSSFISNQGIPPNSTTNFAKTLYGPRLGFGIRWTIMNCMSADFQYAYTWFGTLSTNLVDAVTFDTWTHKSIIHQNSVLLALNYSIG